MTVLARMRVLAPAGEPFPFAPRSHAPLAPGNCVYYTQSGTAALAFALSCIARASESMGAPQRDVLLPAYVCPDVLSAILFAGLRPRLIDLAPDACFPSHERWSESIGGGTLVVLTVGFLGLRDPFTLSGAERPTIPFHLEDCCQVHPASVTHGADRGYVYSFGRGKPVSLLHGGAAVLPERIGEVPRPELAPDRGFMSLLARGLTYNVLRTPMIYAWIRKLPGLQLGATRYKPLNDVRAMHSRMVRRVSVRGIDTSARLRRQRRMQSIFAPLAESASIVDLWTRHGSGDEWLLRYPILVRDRVTRDRALNALDHCGLGASALYASTLPNVPGVPVAELSVVSMENAQQFADRLITLPLHAAVRDRDIEAIGMTLTRVLERS